MTDPQFDVIGIGNAIVDVLAHADDEFLAAEGLAKGTTHIFTLTGLYRFPRNWELGGTIRLVSGNPTNTVQGSVLDLNTLDYSPITASLGQRNPLFHRLDIRIEKKWVFDAWRLGLFLDIQNVYNQQNQEGLIYNYDFTQSVPITGLPIIPALGVRGEM